MVRLRSPRLAALEERVATLEERIGELTDVVAELLVPLHQRDDRRVDQILARYRSER